MRLDLLRICLVAGLFLTLSGCDKPSSAPVTVQTGPGMKTGFEETGAGQRLPIESESDRSVRGAALTLPEDATTPASPASAKGLAGRWLLTLVAEAEVSQPWMIEISGEDGSYDAKVVGSLVRTATEIRGFRQIDDHVQFEIVLKDQAWPFDGVIAAGRVRGCIEFRDRLTLAWLERTRLSSMNSVQTSAPAAGWSEFEAAQRSDDSKDLVKQLLRFVDQQPDSPLVFDALRVAVRMSRRAELSDEQLGTIAERYQELATSWGDRWSANAVETLASDMATAEGTKSESADALALQLAERARDALPEDAPASRKQFVDLAYAVALVHNDRGEEGKKLLDEMLARAPDEGELRYYAAQASEKLQDLDGAIELLVPLWPHPLATRELERMWQAKNGSLAGLDERLDDIYNQRFPPIPVDSFAGREESETNQIAVAELFTGTSCPPCVAADVAFEALGRTFKPADLVLLQYHLHVPGPDPLTNADGMQRARYYKAPGTPFMLLNGRESAQGGGARQRAFDLYNDYRADIEKQLERKTDAKLKLQASREQETITIDVTASDIPDPSERLRLRLAVVEDTVRFNGRNGVRLHHAVVRAMPGGADGIAVNGTELTHHVTVDVADLRESLARELSEFEKQVSTENKISFEFPAKPLDLKRLGVAAFLQDDATQTVLQAAFVELGGETDK